MNYEEKLAAIIEAQAKGGHGKWLDRIGGGSELIRSSSDCSSGEIRMYELSSDELHDKCWCEDSVGILQILLDTKGCKAAYPGVAGEASLSMTLAYLVQNFHKDVVWNWQMASWKILESWDSEDGNNYRAAIDSAYDLLPNVTARTNELRIPEISRSQEAIGKVSGIIDDIIRDNQDGYAVEKAMEAREILRPFVKES